MMRKVLLRSLRVGLCSLLPLAVTLARPVSAGIDLGLLKGEEFDQIVRPEKMIGPGD